jgi:hypothetical protein
MGLGYWHSLLWSCCCGSSNGGLLPLAASLLARIFLDKPREEINMYIYRNQERSLLMRKSSSGKHRLYLNDAGQVFKIHNFQGGLAHIQRNLYGVRRAVATVKLLLVAVLL